VLTNQTLKGKIIDWTGQCWSYQQGQEAVWLCQYNVAECADFRHKDERNNKSLKINDNSLIITWYKRLNSNP
jgi:hypothetical protein